MTLMKAAILYGESDLRVSDIPKATTEKNGVLVRVNAVGVCGSDVHAYKHKLGSVQAPGLIVDGGILLGHEFSGEVVEVGADVSSGALNIGDRVVGFGVGAYATYCYCDESNVYPIPDHLSYEECATVEPLVVSLGAVQRAEPQPGDKILIIGAGTIGLGCVQVLKALHPDCEVIISDVSDKRLALAQTLGADEVINASEQDVIARMKVLTGEQPVPLSEKKSAQVDVVLECAGLAVTINQAVELVNPSQGRVVLVAVYEDMPQIDLNLAVLKNVDIRGYLGYGKEEIRKAIELMASGQVARQSLITHSFPLTEAKQALETQLNAEEAIKVVIHP